MAVESVQKYNLPMMKYKVLVHESEEGFSVSCPGLPGCWSQGETEEEALKNIQDAIREYLAATLAPEERYASADVALRQPQYAAPTELRKSFGESGAINIPSLRDWRLWSETLLKTMNLGLVSQRQIDHES